ncbi:MAG: precorrin-6y C5,15-methyltransferase (decarboxylating) subunit CbiE [Spirochaetales bacterium]|nr:precorrin-6y C5,15-methyltransferase (decarboxylating) subunit CbiE [Spirochaetales bacterium]
MENDGLILTKYAFSIIGIGPGESPYRLPLADKVVQESDLLIGGDRHLSLFRHLGKEEISLAGRINELPQLICREAETKRVGLLVSGDPGYHSPLRLISTHFDRRSYRVIPGLSSFQLAAARSGKPWQDDLLLSLHGKEEEEWTGKVLQALESGHRAILLTDRTRTPRFIARKLSLTASPKGPADGMILELYYRLGHDDERSEILQAEELLARPAEQDDKETLCVMIIHRP